MNNQIDLSKVYDYYTQNINKSCNTIILNQQDFEKAFVSFLHSLEIMHAFQPDLVNIPVYNEKCKTSKIVNLDTVLNKII